MKCISLFSGVAGLEVGLRKSNLRVLQPRLSVSSRFSCVHCDCDIAALSNFLVQFIRGLREPWTRRFKQSAQWA